MVPAERLREMALGFEGTAEARHFDRRAFRARRIFATLAADGRSANVRLSPDEQEFRCMMNPGAFSPIPNAWGRKGWTIVVLDRVEEEELFAALEMAYRHGAAPAGRPRRPTP